MKLIYIYHIIILILFWRYYICIVGCQSLAWVFQNVKHASLQCYTIHFPHWYTAKLLLGLIETVIVVSENDFPVNTDNHFFIVAHLTFCSSPFLLCKFTKYISNIRMILGKEVLFCMWLYFRGRIYSNEDLWHHPGLSNRMNIQGI